MNKIKWPWAIASLQLMYPDSSLESHFLDSKKVELVIINAIKKRHRADYYFLTEIRDSQPGVTQNKGRGRAFPSSEGMFVQNEW